MLDALRAPTEQDRQRLPQPYPGDARSAPRIHLTPPSTIFQKDILPKVAVLMCTLRGQHFLSAQLNSIAAQNLASWHLWVSDDGSSDRTRAILEEYRAAWGKDRISIHDGPQEGFVANFLSLTCKADVEANYYAYADQDDVWESDKLQRAVRWLDTIPRDIPALYCSRTRLVDAHEHEIGLSPLFPKSPGFANALVQNIGGGNTMVFNHAARMLLCEAGHDVNVVAHDWWAYMVITGCGGQVFYDANPSVLYRQHQNNQIGSGATLSDRLARMGKLLQGRFREWNDINTSALQSIRHRLTPQNRRILDNFCAARNSWLLPRLVGLQRSRVYRQTVFGNMSLIAAAVLKKL